MKNLLESNDLGSLRLPEQDVNCEPHSVRTTPEAHLPRRGWVEEAAPADGEHSRMSAAGELVKRLRHERLRAGSGGCSGGGGYRQMVLQRRAGSAPGAAVSSTSWAAQPVD